MHPWIYEHYVEPILLDTGYNPVNTLTWALILGLMIAIIIRLFRRMDLELDESLVVHTIPYILAGSSLRVIEDAGLVAPPASYLLITPLIYFLVSLVTLTSLFLTRSAFGSRWMRVYALIGLAWTAINLAVLATLGAERLWALVVILGLGSAFSGALWALRSPLKLKFLETRQNMLILFSHLWDASSTYIGIDLLGYHEKHVIPDLLIRITGTAFVMYPLKLVILLPVLGLIDDVLRDDPQLKNLTKLALLVLGLAPALRNTLRLVLGV